MAPDIPVSDILRAAATVIGALLTGLFAINLFFIRSLYTDFKHTKKISETNTAEINSTKERISGIESTYQERSKQLKERYDEKVGDVQKSLEKTEANLLKNINDVGQNVKQLAAKVERLDEMKVDVSTLKNLWLKEHQG